MMIQFSRPRMRPNWMRNLCLIIAGVLFLVWSISVFAGDVQGPPDPHEGHAWWEHHGGEVITGASICLAAFLSGGGFYARRRYVKNKKGDD